MKKTDIAMIILIAGVSALLAYTAANSMPFFKPSEKGVKVKTIDRYSEELEDPDRTVFNANAINPTVKTVIGNGSSEN